jgi:GMP synthase (glutamine-hydrolysing)
MSCEPLSQKSMVFRGRRRPNREIMSIRLKELGLEPVVHRPIDDIGDFPTEGECGGIIIGGSTLYIFDKDLAEHEWMRKMLDFIREASEKVPVLGLCFGHQVIGRAFGTDLKLYGPEMGYEAGFVPVRLTAEGINDPLFKNFPESFEALFSHFSYIDTVPDGGVLLLTPEDPKNPSIQGFRVGESTWGVQFHPEYPPKGLREVIKGLAASVEGTVDMETVLKTFERDGRQDHLVLKNFADFLSRS